MALRDIRKAFGDRSDAPSLDQLKIALRAFFARRTDLSPTQVKYVCYGVTVPHDDTEDGVRIIDDRALFQALMKVLGDYETQEGRFRQCYQGLLQGYFGFRRDPGEKSQAHQNWINLRRYLSERLPAMHAKATSREFVPDWLGTLNEHKNLLTDNPCGRYADMFEAGKTDELRALFGGLGIESNSWIWDEVVMAYVRSVCERGDAEFYDALRCVLPFLNGRADIKLPQLLAVRATAMIVKRYAQCRSRPEHDGLRDTCVALIGNPWLDPTAWHARVGYEPAREMVEGWLKRRLIKDFFEVLAKDGAADLRRLHYWLKWEPQISDMWFVLGADARNNRTAAFSNVRKRMGNRERVLEKSTADNNAFIMRIGPLIVIEFGLTGNACFFFSNTTVPVTLSARAFDLSDLKNTDRMLEKHSHHSGWEDRFDSVLSRLLDERSANGHPPEASIASGQSRPSSSQRIATPRVARPDGWEIQELLRKCAKHGISYEDNRPKRGALWVLLSDPKRSPRIAEELVEMGFKYKEGSGFWIK
ncbi:EH signature domain-containing protein [Caballeronia calidae]|nr:EH signature domain-containing protein [Caballeronia calidae]